MISDGRFVVFFPVKRFGDFDHERDSLFSPLVGRGPQRPCGPSKTAKYCISSARCTITSHFFGVFFRSSLAASVTDAFDLTTEIASFSSSLNKLKFHRPHHAHQWFRRGGFTGYVSLFARKTIKTAVELSFFLPVKFKIA